MIDAFPQAAGLATFLDTGTFSPEAIAAKTRLIYSDLLATSGQMRGGNFAALADKDLQRLFVQYDFHFFAGALHQKLAGENSPLHFRVAPRMTRAGGKTFRYERREHRTGRLLHRRFEIAVSSTLLFQTFHDVDRTVRINGLECADRLEALQRIMEHEILHLAELLVHDKSSCAAARYHDMARRIFGHTAATHDMVTQQERAAASYQIRVGDRVAFVYEGRRCCGIVNRIVRRATILVEDPAGLPYSDGKRYEKYYIPLEMLERAP